RVHSRIMPTSSIRSRVVIDYWETRVMSCVWYEIRWRSHLFGQRPDYHIPRFVSHLTTCPGTARGWRRRSAVLVAREYGRFMLATSKQERQLIPKCASPASLTPHCMSRRDVAVIVVASVSRLNLWAARARLSRTAGTSDLYVCRHVR